MPHRITESHQRSKVTAISPIYSPTSYLHMNRKCGNFLKSIISGKILMLHDSLILTVIHLIGWALSSFVVAVL